MTRNRLLFLYTGVPLLLALYNGLHGSFWSPTAGIAKMVLMYASCALPLWLFSGFLSHALLSATRRLHVHPFFALLATLPFSIPFSYFVVLNFIILFGGMYPGLESGLAADGKALVGGLENYRSTFLIIAVWLTSNWIYECATGEVVFYQGFIGDSESSLPRAASTDTDPIVKADTKAPAPKFLQRVRPLLGTNLLALEAQQHYVKVYTDRGADMILYRFSDAVQEVASLPGFRVHRSYWVAHDAVVDIRNSGKNYKLTLRNGLTVPVSRSYRSSIQPYRAMFARNHAPGAELGSLAVSTRAS